MNSMFFIAAVNTADFWRQQSSSLLLLLLLLLPAELRGILNAKICDQPSQLLFRKKLAKISFFMWAEIYGTGMLNIWRVLLSVITEVCRACWWIIRWCNDAGHYHSFSVGTNTVIFRCIMPNIQGDKEPPQPGWLRLILYSLVSLPGLAWPSPSRAGEEIKDSFREN